MTAKKILSTLILLTALTTASQSYAGDNTYIQNMYSKPLNLIESSIQTQRIPAGTLINLRLETPINSLTSRSGSEFNATVIENVKIGKKVVLPIGSLVRGIVCVSKKNTFVSQPGYLSLTFDHVVTPLGKQLPIVVRTNNLNANKDDIIKGEGGYFRAVNNHFEKSIDILDNTTVWGYKKGKSFAKGIPAIITTPICALGGSVYGSSYFAYNTFMSFFRKGDNVILNPGQNIQIISKEDIDLVLN
ncbi:MAG: hypothetical protein WCK67_05060 [bacterium]